ncbi:hypothetical protein [Acidithiobacillus sulfurivorans]|uniref:Uncharacterized protein n=1 Tax=Acidithiobacillus sulfurivorans TaxID=1958756 RepID=A0ABS6A0G1_9PROT|nr:hypothetical protein [Acidithiobacillus sulfurivorans]MBU2760972.1 hypothetical protein [Acidithiobacillus sulfurivorans]
MATVVKKPAGTWKALISKLSAFCRVGSGLAFFFVLYKNTQLCALSFLEAWHG